MIVLLGVRHEDDLLYRDELEALAAAHSNLRFVPTLSRGDDSWSGRRGWVQTHVPDLWRALGDDAHLYVCGLERMVKAVREVVRKELGAPRERVHSERYD
jgi:NAD(P)H-flavin reductase